jgi:hypothetical protein
VISAGPPFPLSFIRISKPKRAASS